MPSSDADSRRGLRDHPLGRVAILLVVLVLAAVVARSCSGGEADISKERAVEIAREVLIFDAESVQVRFLRQGVNSTAYWLVSFYDGDPRNPTRYQLVRVNAETGEITDDGLRDDV